MKSVMFPTGETAMNLINDNKYQGLYYIDENNKRKMLPNYLSTYYKNLGSNLLYSSLLCNKAYPHIELSELEEAKNLLTESINFIPVGVDYPDPFVELEKLGK